MYLNCGTVCRYGAMFVLLNEILYLGTREENGKWHLDCILFDLLITAYLIYENLVHKLDIVTKHVISMENEFASVNMQVRN